jgi:hypothetical protein
MWDFVKGIIDTAATFGALYLTWKQMALQKRSADPRSVYRRDSVWRRYWPMVVMGCLAILTWAGVLVARWTADELAPSYITGWGAANQPNLCAANVNGDALVPAGKQFQVALICGFESTEVDRAANTDIVVSNAFSIRPGNIQISMPWGGAMKRAFTETQAQQAASQGLAPGAKPPVTKRVFYVAILLPIGTDTRTILRMSDVPQVGGHVLVNRLPLPQF